MDFLDLEPLDRFSIEKRRGEAFGIIKLFGSEELNSQVDDFVEFLKSKNEGYFSYDPIMNLLRDELREEYGLPKTKSRYLWLDLKFNKVDQNESADP